MRTATLALAALLLVHMPTRAQQPPPRLSVLIVDGMNNHDWQRATRVLRDILRSSGRFTVDVSTTPPTTQPVEAWNSWHPAFDRYDVVLSNFNGGHVPGKGARWPREVQDSLESYVRNGGGLSVYHAANNSFPDWPAYNDMIGLGWRSPAFGPSIIIDKDERIVVIPKGQGRNPGHGPEHDFQVTTLNLDHPITKGMPK